MIRNVIDAAIRNRALVIIATLALALAGFYALTETPLDAIPDLSDVQVIIFTEHAGQAPRIIEDQITYPLTTQMLSVPFAKVVRGLLLLRLLLRLRHLRGRHRPVLGAEPRARVPQLRVRPAARGRHAHARARRLGRRLGVHVRALVRPPRPQRAPLDPGLVPEVRARERARRVRGREHRRLRASVSGHGRSDEAPSLRHPDLTSAASDPGEQRGRRRPRARGRGEGVHDPRAGLPELARGPAEGRPRRRRGRDAHSSRGRRARRHRSGASARHRRLERRGRDGRRHRRRAAGCRHPQRDPRRQGQARDRARRAPRGRRGEDRLRPERADRARGGQPSREPAAAVPDRGARVRVVPVPRPERARGGDFAPGGHPHGLHRHALAGHRHQHHVARRHRGRDRHDGRRRDRHGGETPTSTWRAATRRARTGRSSRNRRRKSARRCSSRSS